MAGPTGQREDSRGIDLTAAGSGHSAYWNANPTKARATLDIIAAISGRGSYICSTWPQLVRVVETTPPDIWTLVAIVDVVGMLHTSQPSSGQPPVNQLGSRRYGVLVYPSLPILCARASTIPSRPLGLAGLDEIRLRNLSKPPRSRSISASTEPGTFLPPASPSNPTARTALWDWKSCAALLNTAGVLLPKASPCWMVPPGFCPRSPNPDSSLSNCRHRPCVLVVMGVAASRLT